MICTANIERDMGDIHQNKYNPYSQIKKSVLCVSKFRGNDFHYKKGGIVEGIQVLAF